MDYRRPQGRKDLNTWRHYNSHFNAKLPQLQHQQVPPQFYKNAFQQNYYNFPPQPHKKVKNKKPKLSYCQRFIKAFDEYCDTSTLHGLKYVGDNRISKFERAFWFTAFSVAACMAMFFISKLYINYGANPVIIGFNPGLVAVKDIPFPAITICNFNVAMKKHAQRVNTEGDFLVVQFIRMVGWFLIKFSGFSYLAYFCFLSSLLIMDISEYCRTEEEKLVLEDLCNIHNETSYDHGSISWPTIQDTILNITQKCTEMIIACKWQEKLYVCAELINSVITDDGYCCSFNKLPVNYSQKYDTDTQRYNLDFPKDLIRWNIEEGYPLNVSEGVYPYRAFGRGTNQGLTLVLDANLEEYYCSTTNSVGFKIIFATPLDSPKIASLGFLIPPGIETRIAINAQVSDADKSIRNIHWSKRKCLYSSERFLQFFKLYSARNCILECEANYTLKKCGCATFDMPRTPDTEICGKSKHVCVDNARFKIERFGADKSACGCLPGCFEIHYTPGIISVGKLPAMYDTVDKEYIGNISREYFAKNMAIVHVYYPVDKFQRQTKRALYGFSEFLSNTGGILGLFMGFSCLSIVEIIYFLFLRSLCKWGRNKYNNKNTTPLHFVN